MPDQSEFLSREELQILTGYKRPTYQATWCTNNSIDYRINARGDVVVSRHDVRERSLKTFAGRAARIEPDLSRV
jgi:hypothetical protein